MNRSHQRPTECAMPTFAWVGLTSRCNLDCTHCQRGHLTRNGLLRPAEMPEWIVKKLEAQLFPHLERIQFGGNNFGEPLLASNWDSCFARVCHFRMRISLVTNGTLLTAERIRAMVDAGVEFNFSMEGATPQSYEKVRGHKFAEFVRVLEEVCRQKDRNPATRARANLGFTASYGNILEITELIVLASRLGVDRITVTHFVPWKESQRQNSLVYHPELSNDMLQSARRMAAEAKLTIDLPEPFASGENSGGAGGQQVRQSGESPACNLPWTSVSINEQGDVMPCCATSVVMGNLNSADLRDIWNGRRYAKLRDTVNSPRAMGFCRNCALRGIKVGSDEPLSFCSEKSVLLGSIGVEAESNYMSSLRMIRKRLLKTGLGKKTVPFLNELYRRHLAFHI
jgi:radical SAM protein with 4Fe4S-binding SPASM domain